MAHTYTPGLRVTDYTIVRKQRRLPLTGHVTAGVGDRVSRDQIVAYTQLPGDVITQNLVNRLGVTAAELPEFMLKQPGDTVSAGEPIAETSPWIKWFKTVVNAEVDGVIETVSSVTGQVLLRKPPVTVELSAFINGVVVEELPQEGIVIETPAAYVQGIFGVGGERWGSLRVLAQSPDEPLEATQIDDNCRDCVLLGGSIVSIDALKKAADVGASGVIVGGIHDSDLQKLLGYEIGVAITGTENIATTVVITEGFGQMSMAHKTFNILRSCEGQDGSSSGATQIRAGVLRPEIIIPKSMLAPAKRSEAEPGSKSLAEGDTLRIIRSPHFGRIATVINLISDRRIIDTGAEVRVVEVKFEDGTQAIVPRANIEFIDE